MNVNQWRKKSLTYVEVDLDSSSTYSDYIIVIWSDIRYIT